jgi:tetratricopeptide (TPR) repeat protein
MKSYKTVALIAIIILINTGCSIKSSLPEVEEKSKRGDEYFAAGDIDNAIEMWEKALQCKKTTVLYEKIVTVQIIKNDFSKAEKWTAEGLTYFPNSVNLIFNNALISFNKQDFVNAMHSLDRVLEINEYYPNAHFLKGLIYEKQGDAASARKEFINEVNINPGSKKAWQKLRGLTND